MGQQSTESFTFDGETRQYIQYVPASYDPGTPIPVVFSLHGMGDNMTNFSNVGLHQVADTANFIVITPQALLDPLMSSSAWNSGAGMQGYTLNGNVDDISFLSAIMDTLEVNFNINISRIYSCGFSLGGFMSHRLACDLGHRVAAIASVAGTIGNDLVCTPSRAVPVCHFHGSGDGTVPFVGNGFGLDALDLIDFWVNNNACAASPTQTSLPDIAADNLTVEHFEYGSCTDNSGVEFFRVDSADHVWLSANNDISYTLEIWKFFSKYEHPYTNVGFEEQDAVREVSLYPNPATEAATLSINLSAGTDVRVDVHDALGRNVATFNQMLDNGINDLVIETTDLISGLYFVSLSGKDVSVVERLFVVK